MAIAVAVLPEGKAFTFELGNKPYKRIVEVIGGYIDSVSHPSIDEIVGYVHDEGLLIGLEPNNYASYIFDRPLVGPLVIVGALNADGERDGEDYDAPEKFQTQEFFDFIADFNANVELKGLLANTIAEMDFAPTVIGMNAEQMDAWFKDGTLPEEVAK